MEHGFLRYDILLVNSDGSESVIEHDATAHRCNILQRSYKRKANRLGINKQPPYRFRVSRILL